jgi:hypothetical protein
MKTVVVIAIMAIRAVQQASRAQCGYDAQRGP